MSKRILNSVLGLAIALTMFVSAHADNAFISKTATVGKQPVAIFPAPTPNKAFVVCMGADSAYNGVQDFSDEPASVWSIDYSNKEALTFNREKTFEFGYNSIGFPYRPSFNDSIIYMNINGKANLLFLNDFTLMPVAAIDAAAINVYNNMVYFSVRHIPAGSWTPDTNFVIAYNPLDHSVDTIPAKMGVQMTKGFVSNGKNCLAVLCEGISVNDGVVMIYEITDTGYTLIKEIPAGSFANHIAINEDFGKMLITSNGTFKVIVADLKDLTVTGEAIIPVSGYNGPREAAFSNDGASFYVSAYDGKVYQYSLTDYSKINEFTADGKAEGLFVPTDESSELVFAAACPNLSDYSANDLVTLVFKNGTSVIEAGSASVSVYPNPCADRLTVSADGAEGVYSLEITNIIGEKIATDNVTFTSGKSVINVTDLGLSSGAYLLTFKNDNKIISTIAVVK